MKPESAPRSRAIQRLGAIGVFSLTLAGPSWYRGPAGSAELRAPRQDDTLRLYYMGYPIGYERWALIPNGSGFDYAADFDYKDRGRRTHLVARAHVAGDWTPALLEVTRLTDTSSRVDARVDVAGRAATVTRNGTTAQVQLPATAFVIAGQSPTSQQMLLLHYWLAHGRPASLGVVPGGPTNEVRIVQRGRDTLAVSGQRVILDRYAVNGVVWGWGSAWLDAEGRLAAFSSGGGGGLTLESVRTALDAHLPALRASGTRDRIAELAALTRQVHPVASGSVALVGATLVTGTSDAAIPNATVVVADGRIVAAGAAAGVAIPPGARRVDLTGKTIAPGLWDMHTHLMQGEWGPVYLAAGVTTVRDMGNVNDFIVPVRAAVDSGRIMGPTMLLAGLIDGGGPDAFGAVNATTPDEGRAAVRYYKSLGFEQVKLYTLLTPGVVAAICAEAHRVGMTVSGHVPASLTLLAAVDSGMDHIAHMPIRGDASDDSVRRIIATLAARGTVIDPTASWGELGAHSTAIPVSSFQPAISRVPPVLYQRISNMGAAIDTSTWRERQTRTLGIIGALYRAGVPIVAGTDEGVPGFSVYREVELYRAAGMTPLDALRAATAVSAKAMGRLARSGTIEPGKDADLIVLDANPLEAPANLWTVRMVMKGGTLYRSADIWAQLGFGSGGPPRMKNAMAPSRPRHLRK